MTGAQHLWILLAIAMPSVFGEEPITIKVHHTHNRVVIPGKINDQPFSFLLDSACTIPTLHPAVIDQLQLESSGTQKIIGIAGEERAPTYRNIVIDFGEAKYAPRRVASIPSEREDSRRRRDGVIGSGFFERFVVELDHRASAVRLYSTTNFNYTGKGEMIPFRMREEIPVVDAAILMPGRDITSQFEVDTGCDSGLCLGAKFVNDNKLLEVTDSRSSAKFGIGGSVETKSGTVPILRLGKLEIEKPQTDFFREGSPVDEPMAGHIGMGVFHRYKVIFDYPRRRIILETY